MLFKHHSRYYSVLRVGMNTSLAEGLRCITWNTKSLVGFVFSKQKNKEFKLKYLKNINNNNIVCLQEVHGRDEYLQAIQVLAPRFRFLVPPFLKTKTQEDRLSAFTGIFYLKRPL